MAVLLLIMQQQLQQNQQLQQHRLQPQRLQQLLGQVHQQHPSLQQPQQQRQQRQLQHRQSPTKATNQIQSARPYQMQFGGTAKTMETLATCTHAEKGNVKRCAE